MAMDFNLGATAKASTRASGNASLRVTGLRLINKSAGTLFFGLYNAAAAPSNGDAPVYLVRCPALSEVFDDLMVAHPNGISGIFTTGLAWAWSSTDTTLTLHGTASDLITAVFYS